MTKPETPPEADLIKAALKRRRMTARKAAELADISEARWYQIMRGSQTVAGERVRVKAPPDTLARMAHVAGVTPEQLEEAGRGDAAEELRALSAVQATQLTPVETQSLIHSDSRARGIWDLDLSLAEREQMIRDLVEADLRRARESEEKERSREAG